MFGQLVTGTEASFALFYPVGLFVHYMNGANFGLFYAFVWGKQGSYRKAAQWGVAWLLIVETGSGGAQLTDWARRMQGRGVSPLPQIDWSALMDFKRSFTEPVPADRERRFQKAGIDTFHGTAHFVRWLNWDTRRI